MTTPSLELDFSARIAASLDGVTAALDRESRWRQKVAEAISQVPFAGSISLSGGAGSYTNPEGMQAKRGYIWGIRRLTANGWTAGSVTAFRNSVLGEPVMPFPVPAVNTTGRGELLLMPGDSLQWSATGITGTVTFWGVADCFESWYLPFYIG